MEPPVPAGLADVGALALGEDQRVPLRLTVTRGVLGMELYEPIEAL